MLSAIAPQKNGNRIPHAVPAESLELLFFSVSLFRRMHYIPDDKPERRALAQLTIHAVVIAVHFEDGLDDGQTQSRAYNLPLVILRAVVLVENQFPW